MKGFKFGSILATAMLFFSIVATVAQPQQGGQGGPRQEQGTPEEQAKAAVERLTEALDLDKEQQKAIYEINLEAAEARANQPQGQRPDREAMMAAREQMTKKIKAVLTKEQVKKYNKLESEMQQQGGPGQGGQGQGRR